MNHAKGLFLKYKCRLPLRFEGRITQRYIIFYWFLMQNYPLPKDAFEQVERYLLTLQNSICNALAIIDEKGTFIDDAWTREQGGGGCEKMEGRVIADTAGEGYFRI